MKEYKISDQLSLAMLESIIENSEDAIITKTLEGIITGWNRASQRIFGYTAGEAVGRHITLLIPPEFQHEEDLIIFRLKQGNRIEHFETTRRRKDGTEITVSLTISPVKNAGGEIIGAAKIVRDITDKKRSEIKQAMAAAIIESSEDAIISKTLDGYITGWNKGAEKIFGYPEKEALGSHISILVPADRTLEENIILRKIKEGKKIEHFQTVRLSRDKREIPISLTVSAIKDAHGNIVGASKIARDITERTLMEGQLKQYNDDLERLNQSKDNFIGMASHELKTPLTSISGYLQLLKRSPGDGQNDYFLNKTISQVSKLTALIADLLDISKIQAGKMNLNCTQFEIGDLIKECIETIEQTKTSHQIILEGSEISMSIQADKTRIEQVLLNLLTNAVKYSPGPEPITVKLCKTAETIEVSVQDSGIGIPAAEINKIFSRFYRVEGLAPTYSGLGIGLYISKEIIERHRGKMYVESEPDRGSTFYFELPIK